MAGRSCIGCRLVSLVAAAATLLAAWLPPGRACACGPINGPARPAVANTTAGTAPVCPCCGQRPAKGKAPKPCCAAPAGTPKGCDCGPVGQPDQRQPAAPPSQSGWDDGPVSAAGDIMPTSVNVSVTAGPTADELAVRRLALPPTDLVISLSRFTC